FGRAEPVLLVAGHRAALVHAFPPRGIAPPTFTGDGEAKRILSQGPTAYADEDGSGRREVHLALLLAPVPVRTAIVLLDGGNLADAHVQVRVATGSVGVVRQGHDVMPRSDLAGVEEQHLVTVDLGGHVEQAVTATVAPSLRSTGLG